MRLSRYLASMTIFLVAVFAIGIWLTRRLEGAFLANPLLNAGLIAVWLIGIAYIVLQTLRLAPEIKWKREVQRNRMAVKDMIPPPLMSTLARLMEARATPLSLTPTALRAVLDGIAVRLDESREIARYFIGLMIFLGLLGTFWGLLKTVGSVGAVVNSLSVTADPTELFTNLKAGLQGPLVGMGTAFGSSLLGLAGSLVLGFLDLQMGQAQNRFFVDLEDWLVASGSAADHGLGEDATPLPAIQALVDRTAVNIESFGRIMANAEIGRKQSVEALWAVAEKIDGLMAAQDSQQQAIEAIVNQRMETDAAIVAMLNRLDQTMNTIASTSSPDLSGQLRAIETGLQRLANDQTHARARALDDARAEITRLARTIGIVPDKTGP